MFLDKIQIFKGNDKVVCRFVRDVCRGVVAAYFQQAGVRVSNLAPRQLNLDVCAPRPAGPPASPPRPLPRGLGWGEPAAASHADNFMLAVTARTRWRGGAGPARASQRPPSGRPCLTFQSAARGGQGGQGTTATWHRAPSQAQPRLIPSRRKKSFGKLRITFKNKITKSANVLK